MGKTALADYVAGSAAGFWVRRIRAAANEQQIPYAALQLLCTPLLDRVPLPTAQRQALSAAFGHTAGENVDRSLVSLAVLNLLCRIADTQPLLCIIDDAQWLDTPSANVLTFVARRAVTSSLVLLLTERDCADSELGAMPRMHLEPLHLRAAQALLAQHSPADLDPYVKERALIESGGNPRRIINAFAAADAAALAGGYAPPTRVPPPFGRAHRCRDKIRRLPADGQRLLLLAAAEPTGDPLVFWRAAEQLGIPSDASTDLVSHGLMGFGRRITLSCPCLRPTLYKDATHESRTLAHRALADATDPVTDPDRRAWHLALATNGFDDALAQDLEAMSTRAQARGGEPARAAFLEHAALLSSDPGERARRAVAAANCKRDIGAGDDAHDLLVVAQAGAPNAHQQASITLQHAWLTAAAEPGDEALAELIDAAHGIETFSVASAREALLDSLVMAMSGGAFISSQTTHRAAQSAAQLVSSSSDTPSDLLLKSLSDRVLHGYADAKRASLAALEAFERDPFSPGTGRWAWLASCIAADYWDDRAWSALSKRRRHVNVHETATPKHAPLLASVASLYRGEAAQAHELLVAGADSDRAAPQGTYYPSLLLAAWRGQSAHLARAMPALRSNAIARADDITLAGASLAEAVLNNGSGQYADALEAAESAARSHNSVFAGWALLEMVEAATRTGDTSKAESALEQLVKRTTIAGTEWALGVEASARAQLAQGASAEALHQEAITRLSRTGMRLHQARAQLLYGEWLRRQSRRVDARQPLRSAQQVFLDIGAEGFAQRALQELLATGEKARKRNGANDTQLTPQEARIAELACTGATNPEIGAQLYVSPRTVEYHLHKVFAKLEISSRTELHLVLDQRSSRAVRVGRP